MYELCVLYKSGNYLLSQTVSNLVSSAQGSLTTVFGMGTGDPSRHRHRKLYFVLPMNLQNYTMYQDD